MILQGRAISSGKAQGTVVAIDGDFSFLGGVDTSTGELRAGGEGVVSQKVFAFRRGKGSTVGSYTIFDLKSKGLAPAAIVNTVAETIVTTGAVISDIPMVDGIDVSVLRNGDMAIVDGDHGTIELPDIVLKEVVTGIVQRDDDVLIMRRSDRENHFPGMWGGASGRIEDGESPLQAAMRELREETGIEAEAERVGEPFLVRNEGIIWRVHPVLFRSVQEPVLNWEHSEHRWCSPWSIDYHVCVPRLEEVMRRLGL